MLHIPFKKIIPDTVIVAPSPDLVYQKLQEKTKIISHKGQEEFTRAITHFNADSSLIKIKKDKRGSCALKKFTSPLSRFKRSYMKDNNGEIYVFGHGCIYHREKTNVQTGLKLKVIRVKFRFKQDGTPSIVKIIQENFISYESAQVFHNEMSIAHHFQQALDDKATIRQLETHAKAYLALPFRGMSLTDVWNADLLSTNKHLTLYTLKEIFRKIHHIHQERYLHCDLKTDNIMMDVTWDSAGQMRLALNDDNHPNIHIVDYGFSVKLSPSEEEYKSPSLCGTENHLPLELLKFKKSPKSQIDTFYVFNRALDYYAISVDARVLLSTITAEKLSAEDTILFQTLSRINASMASYEFQERGRRLNASRGEIKIKIVSKNSPQLALLESPVLVVHEHVVGPPVVSAITQPAAALLSENHPNDMNLLQSLKKASQEIVDAYNTYFNCCSFFSFKHGGEGKKRARDLNREVHEATNIESIKAAFKNCFASYKTCWDSSGETKGINNHSLIAFILKIFAKSEYQAAAQELGLKNLDADKDYFTKDKRNERQQLKNKLNAF